MRIAHKSLGYKVLTAIVLVMMVFAALPVTDAQAATSILVNWTKAYDQASGTGNTFNATIPNGSNRILVVGIATESTNSGTVGNPTTITYGGQTLTLATGNGATNGRMHTWLYYLKDNAVMDNTARPLNVTMGAGAIVNMTVWYAVYAGVDQAPASYTTGNNLVNGAGSGPIQLSANMAVNAGEQAVYISSAYNDTNVTLPAYTLNANWTSGGTNTGTNAAPFSWRVQVANRNVPGANVTDNAATGAVTPAGTIRYAISAMSLPAAPVPAAPTSFSSSATTTFTVGTTNTFNVTANGSPAPTYAIQTGSLPSGVTLSPAGVLSGTPATGTVNTYPVTIRATNASGFLGQEYHL
ncbi:MAG: putative Ig domain-containing protein [Anaerolineales bacterium]